MSLKEIELQVAQSLRDTQDALDEFKQAVNSYVQTVDELYIQVQNLQAAKSNINGGEDVQIETGTH